MEINAKQRLQVTASRPFKKGDKVKIRKEWQDKGDEGLTFTVLTDEEKGRTDISADGIHDNMKLKPHSTVTTEMIEHA